MAATLCLFLLTISLASGAFYPVHRNGSPSMGQPFPKLSVSPQMFLDNCRLRRSSALGCYIELQHIFRRFRADPKPKLGSNVFNARSSIQGILSENNKQTDKPESYINSILDEDKRDASNFNASDSALNSTWIEVKDPRKTATPIKSEIANEEIKAEFASLKKENIVITEKPIKSEIANEEETDEFVSFKEENIITEKADPSIAKEKEIIATGGSNADGETRIQIQQTTTTTEASDVVTSAKADKNTPITRETSDITPIKEATERKTSVKQDTTSTAENDDEGSKRNTKVQEETTGVSSSENVEKSTTADLHIDSAKIGLKVTTETTTVNETVIVVTTGERSKDTEDNLSTESRSTSTSVMPEDTTLTTDDFTTATVFTRAPPTDPTKSESVSDADISTSSETESATSSLTGVFPSVSVTGSSGYKTESSDGDFNSTVVTDQKSSSGDYVTKSIPVVPEHTINIRSIKIAKVVLSVLLLVTGLIAVVMLAVYFFRVRRGAVQYDQLTLLP